MIKKQNFNSNIIKNKNKINILKKINNTILMYINIQNYSIVFQFKK